MEFQKYRQLFRNSHYNT